MTQAKTKEEYVLEGFRRSYPARTARYEREWNSIQCAQSVSTDTKIDWTKPLKPVGGARIRSVVFKEHAFVLDQTVHVCEITYDSNGYNYFVMYDDYGRSLGKNAGTINVKNEVTSWGKSAWMVLDKRGGILSAKHTSRESAEQHARNWHTGAARPLQYIRYDYTESR